MKSKFEGGFGTCNSGRHGLGYFYVTHGIEVRPEEMVVLMDDGMSDVERERVLRQFGAVRFDYTLGAVREVAKYDAFPGSIPRSIVLTEHSEPRPSMWVVRRMRKFLFVEGFGYYEHQEYDESKKLTITYPPKYYWVLLNKVEWIEARLNEPCVGRHWNAEATKWLKGLGIPPKTITEARRRMYDNDFYVSPDKALSA